MKPTLLLFVALAIAPLAQAKSPPITVYTDTGSDNEWRAVYAKGKGNRWLIYPDSLRHNKTLNQYEITSELRYAEPKLQTTLPRGTRYSQFTEIIDCQNRLSAAAIGIDYNTNGKNLRAYKNDGYPNFAALDGNLLHLHQEEQKNNPIVAYVCQQLVHQ